MLLSIVIPDLANSELLESSLVSVLEHRPRSCEILVTHASTYDDPYQLGREEIRLITLPSAAPLTACLNTALRATRGEIVHLLMPGSVVEEGWTEAPCAAILHRPSLAAVSPTLIDSRQRHTAGIRWHRQYARQLVHIPARPMDANILGPTMCAGFYRRSALLELGGLDLNAPLEEADLDLACALQAAGYEAEHIPACRVHLSRNPLPRTSGFRRARYREHLARRYRPGATRSFVATTWYLATRSLWGLPFPWKWPTTAGRLLGALDCLRGIVRRDTGASHVLPMPQPFPRRELRKSA